MGLSAQILEPLGLRDELTVVEDVVEAVPLHLVCAVPVTAAEQRRDVLRGDAVPERVLADTFQVLEGVVVGEAQQVDRSVPSKINDAPWYWAHNSEEEAARRVGVGVGVA